jgi:aspartate racemase
MIGVIGGMGPLATADFLNKVIEESRAIDDEGHVPKRPAAILAGGESPLPRLLEIRDRLLVAGATALVMPCNTAHHWYRALAADCAVPFLDMVEVGCQEAARRAASGASIAVVGTRATLATGLFDEELLRRGLVPVHPTEDELERLLLPAIAAVKAGRAAAAGPWLAEALGCLVERGAAHIVLACTELPLALVHVSAELSAICVDNNRALARATVALWHGQLCERHAAGARPPE